MKILLCDSNVDYLSNLISEGTNYITATNATEAIHAQGINIAVISVSIPEWELLAKHFVDQGATTYIMADNISDINLWKKSTELGLKGVWAKSNVKNELANINNNGQVVLGKKQRPLRERLNRSPQSRTSINNQNSPITLQKPLETKKQQPMPFNSMSKQSPIVVRRELICFFGTNGGVGKTTLAVNTGVAFAQQGQSTVVVDFDVFSGDVVTRLAVKPTTTMIDLVKGNTDDVNQCLIDHPSGLKILPAPLNHEEGQLITPEETNKILSALTRRFDVVIVDTAPLLIAPTVITMEHATTVLILCPPDSATVAKTHSVLKRMDMLNFERPKYKLLVTKMPKKPPFLKGDMMAQTLNLQLAGIIPYDEGVQIESNNGNAPVLSRRAKNFSKAVHALCNTIIPVQQTSQRRFDLFKIFKRGVNY